MKLQQNRGAGPSCVYCAVIINDSLTLMHTCTFSIARYSTVCVLIYFICNIHQMSLRRESVFYCCNVRDKEAKLPGHHHSSYFTSVQFMSCYATTLATLQLRPAICQILQMEAGGACTGSCRGHHIVLIPENISD